MEGQSGTFGGFGFGFWELGMEAMLILECRLQKMGLQLAEEKRNWNWWNTRGETSFMSADRSFLTRPANEHAWPYIWTRSRRDQLQESFNWMMGNHDEMRLSSPLSMPSLLQRLKRRLAGVGCLWICSGVMCRRGGNMEIKSA